MATQNEYPSWKDALFADDKIANLRCAGKYVLWQASYLLLAVIGLILVAAITAGKFVADKTPTNKLDPAFNRVGSGAHRLNDGLERSGVKKAARMLAMAFMGLYVVGIVLYALYLMITNPVLTVGVIGGIAVLVALFLGFKYLKNQTTVTETVASSASSAASRAKETPGVRRVYGNCPVHMDLEPKWFQKISE